MPTIRRILTPTDLGAGSEAAVRYSFDLARVLHAEVILLYTYVFPGPPEPASLHPKASRALYDQAVADLERTAAECGSHGVQTRCVVRQGHAVALIIDTALELEADLIVTGKHRRYGFDRALLGSVAEAVVRKASCPVIVVPATSPTAQRTARGEASDEERSSVG